MSEFDSSLDREAYARHIDNDHRRLNDKLKQVRRTVSIYSSSPGAALQSETVRHLSDLRQELAKHFSKEEDGGFIEEAACRCPTLTHEVRSIEKEHHAILAHLDRIIAEQQMESRSETLLLEFDQFIEVIKEHEGHEERVIQRGFNVAMDA